VQTQSAAAQLT